MLLAKTRSYPRTQRLAIAPCEICVAYWGYSRPRRREMQCHHGSLSVAELRSCDLGWEWLRLTDASTIVETIQGFRSRARIVTPFLLQPVSK